MLIIKKNEILPFVTTWMDLECIMLSKISQRKRNIIFHLCVEFKKQNKNKFTDRGKTNSCRGSEIGEGD